MVLLVASLNVTILFVLLAFQSKDLVLAKSETMVLLSIDEKIVPVDIIRPLAQEENSSTIIVLLQYHYYA